MGEDSKGSGVGYLSDCCVLPGNKYNNKMIEQSKSPKSMAYARLGKTNNGKASLQEDVRKPNRNSTGNIYEEILQQIHPDANNYIRQLVTKNQKDAQDQHTPTDVHARKKSYAEILIDTGSKEKPREKAERAREERQTLSRAKQVAQSYLQEVATPKNSTMPLNPRSRNANTSQPSSIMATSFKKEALRSDGSFLESLNNYLEELREAPEQQQGRMGNGIGDEKLSETLKISSGEGESSKLASKLEQCHLKIKQLKLKNYYQEKELGKHSRKELKMKESLFQMLSEIKQLNAQLTYERSQRKKLEKIIDSFDIRRGKPERKTIGKLHHLNNLDPFQEHTENDMDDMDDSFRDYMKRSLEKKAPTSKLYGGRGGGLDSQKVEKLFHSHYNSEESDD